MSEKLRENNPHQEIIERIKKGGRYFTNVTAEDVKIKIEFRGKTMILKRGQSFDLYTGKKVDFLKKKKKKKK